MADRLKGFTNIVKSFFFNRIDKINKNVENNNMYYQNFMTLFKNRKWDEIFSESTPVSIYNEQLKWMNLPPKNFIDYITKRSPLAFDGVPPDENQYKKDPTYMLTQIHRLWVTVDAIKRHLINNQECIILDLGAFPFPIEIILREYLDFQGKIFVTTNWQIEKQWSDELEKRKIEIEFVNLDPYVQSGIELPEMKTNLDFDDNSIDFVICTHVIEHLYHPLKIFKEINRIMKKKGKIIVSTDNVFMLEAFLNFCISNNFLHEPIEGTAAMSFHQWRGHNRFFSNNDLKILLEKSEFKCIDNYFYEVLYNSFNEEYFKNPISFFPKWKADILTFMPQHRNELIVIGEK